jgi:solute:Na+ symporter, SSS family
VQRYLSGSSLRESRLGLMFNAALKIPMQFFILLLGVIVFVFYQFEPQPVFFNQSAWNQAVQRDPDGKLQTLQQEFDAAHAQKEHLIHQWLDAKHNGDHTTEATVKAQALAALDKSNALRDEARTLVQKVNPAAKGNDSDYVLVTFILNYLPHGLIGLLLAAFFAAALQSKSAELNALGSTTTIDFYRHVIKRDASDAHCLIATKWFTLLWGLVALAFALFAHLQENLIQAINIVGSVFYGVVLAIFLIAFFLKHIGGTAIFWAALTSQILVLVLYHFLGISYLWYNFIGPAACILLSLIIQAALGPTNKTESTP